MILMVQQDLGKAYILILAVHGRMKMVHKQGCGNMLKAQRHLVLGIMTMTRLLILQAHGILKKITPP